VPDAPSERRLTAILAADVAGYTRMIGADEAATLALFKAHLAEALAPGVATHGGRIIKTLGDGVLAEFRSSVEALLCAVEFQRAMALRNAGAATAMMFRVGVNAGDVVLEGGDVFGDTVNVTARLEALAPPGGICVSERVREDLQGRADLSFEDTGPQRLKNIERPVRVFRVRLDALANERPTLLLPDKPSIAVLPFQNMSGDASQEYFADGVTEDIITALSRWRWFFVIARNSSFTYKGQSIDITTVGRELGVRYVLEGSVRKAGGHVRVVTQLIEAADATHVWSDTFDRDLRDIFTLHDEITEHVVTAIEPAMLQNETSRDTHKRPGDLSAFDCFQRGMWHLNRVSEQDCRAAERLFREAIARDPDLSLAHTGLSRILYGLVVYGWSTDVRGDLVAAEASARKAIDLDPRDALAHFALSGALLYLARHKEALEEATRTIALNSNLAFGHFRIGQVLTYSGRAAEAIAPIERSIRLSPLDPQIGAMRTMLALAHYHAGAYEASVHVAGDANHLGDARTAAVLAAALARLGRHEQARAVLSSNVQQRAAAPAFMQYARAADLQDFLEGLRLAGLGESFAARLEEAPARRD
jgi:TolB-like protein/Tfp pilus assembly protein PilF